MVVELISVGDRAAFGKYCQHQRPVFGPGSARDWNSLSMYNQIVVGDNEERLSEAVRTALRRSDIVILTQEGWGLQRMI